MNTHNNNNRWRKVRSAFVIVISVLIVSFLFRLTEAGSLTPSANPASTAQSLENLYQSLVGTFDSSGISPDKDGSALQISKCIILKVTGGTPCP